MRTDEILRSRADDELKLRQGQELLRGYLAKRKVDHKALDYGEPEKASGNAMRQIIVIRQGIARDLAQKMVKELKGAKLKKISRWLFRATNCASQVKREMTCKPPSP